MHSEHLDQQAIVDYVRQTFPDANVVVGSEGIATGDTFFIHKADERQFPFATIVTKDYGDFDNKSNLNRGGLYRLNVGVSRDTFRALFEPEATHDYAALDTLFPHPYYGPQSWLSVINPSPTTFERLKPLLREAYEIATRRVERRTS